MSETLDLDLCPMCDGAGVLPGLNFGDVPIACPECAVNETDLP